VAESDYCNDRALLEVYACLRSGAKGVERRCRRQCFAPLLVMAAAFAPLVGLGCGSARAVGEGAEAATPGAKGPGGPGVTWQHKTREQRMDWMGLEVLPQTKGSFVKFSASDYATFECQTCHGDNMEAVDFKMPNPLLYALATTNTLEESKSYDAEVTAFMAEVLVPQMAGLLDSQPYDPEAQLGFGCFGCHPAAK
jgi:hypothetical protein